MQVKVLVEFLIDNCRELFGEETSDLLCPADKESPAPAERDAEVRGGTESCHWLGLGTLETSVSFLVGLGIQGCPFSPPCPVGSVWPLPFEARKLCSAR